MAPQALSDKAISVFVFASYHSLVSGEDVKAVVLHDQHGHQADPDGVAELQSLGLLEVNGDRGSFTEAGAQRLTELLSAIKASLQ